jgi:hypothetical protein
MRSTNPIGSRYRIFLGAILAAGLLPACGASKKGGSTPGIDGGDSEVGGRDVRASDANAVGRDIGASDIGASDIGAGDVGASDIDDVVARDVASRDVAADARGTNTADGADGRDVRGRDSETARDVAVDAGDASANLDSPADSAALPDLPPPQDSQRDSVLPPEDVAPDQPVEYAVGPDLLPDLAPDATDTAGLTTMNAFTTCIQYTHTRRDSQGRPYTFGVRDLAFTPDGKHLVSFGEDSRAKAWMVTETGLADAVTGGLIFAGDRMLTGAISADGKHMVIGDQGNNLSLYDLESSLQLGAAVTLAEFPLSALPPDLGGVRRVQFTSDGKHIVAFYSGDLNPDPNHLLVWDIDTQAIVRDVVFDYDDVVRAVMPAAYSEPMWVASSKRNRVDGGGYDYVVSLVDVASPEPRSVVQLRTPDEAVEAAFWPDADTLVLGLDNGEVGRWDISNKADIVRLGTPIIDASMDSSVVSLAFTNDKKHLAAGISVFMGISSVKLYSAEKQTTLHKNLDGYDPWSLAFAPDGLALAIGGETDGALIYCKP